MGGEALIVFGDLLAEVFLLKLKQGLRIIFLKVANKETEKTAN